jgi:drug/metabolite transporter (DMT)-like permease
MTTYPLTPVATFRVHLALLTSSLIYGVFPIAVKLILRTLGPWELILVRLLGTALLVALLELVFFRTRFQSFKDVLLVALLSLLGVGMVQILVVVGINLTTTFHASLLMSTIPLQTLLLGLLLKREVFSWNKITGILIAFTGIALLLGIRNMGTSLPSTYLIGDVVVLLNAFMFSSYLVCSQPILKRVSSFSYMAYSYLFASVFFLVVLSFTPSINVHVRPLTTVFALAHLPWDWLGYVVILASIGTYTLNNYGLSRSQPSTVATYAFIQPMLAAFLGTQWLGEPFTWQMASAGMLTLAGIVLSLKDTFTENNHDPGLLNPKPST